MHLSFQNMKKKCVYMYVIVFVPILNLKIHVNLDLLNGRDLFLPEGDKVYMWHIIEVSFYMKATPRKTRVFVKSLKILCF